MENDTLGANFLLKVSLITSNFESTNLLKSFPIFDLRRCSEQKACGRLHRHFVLIIHHWTQLNKRIRTFLWSFTQTFCMDYSPLDSAKLCCSS